MTSEIKHSHLNPAQVYELNERHGYFEYADAQGDVSAAFANEAVAEYLRVNEEAQAVMAECGLSHRELLHGYQEMHKLVLEAICALETIPTTVSCGLDPSESAKNSTQTVEQKLRAITAVQSAALAKHKEV